MLLLLTKYNKWLENQTMKQHVKTLKLSQMASFLGAIFCANSYAYNCDGLPEWSQNSAYNGGAQVQKSQQAFEAKWD